MRGIVDRLGYLKDLGVNAIYLNPIFSSAANHRYHTYDYFQVDPLLGGNEALRELLDEAHAAGMKVILDGVFNHASRGFWPFHHILENGANSPYLDWFHVQGFPLRPYSSDTNNPANYAGWWGHAALPKINTDNPGARQYIFDVAKYWIDFGADGWRLDVPAEIDDDAFWREFRRIVKTANADAYILGEIWHEARRWLQGDQFDAVMNYYFGKSCVSFFARETLSHDFKHPDYALKQIDALEFASQIDDFLGLYDWQIILAQMNMLDSHDTPRALHLMGESKTAVRLSVLMQMTMPGAPCIYYGSEIGMTGAGDPYCRAAFPWERQESWDSDLLAFYKRVIELRRTHEVLRTGDYRCLTAEGTGLVFRRRINGSEAIIGINAGDTEAVCPVSSENLQERAYYRVWPRNNGEVVDLTGDQLSVIIPAREAVVLVNQRG
ncbi:MAG TPA: glycoside hydrolase family 13 protein [Anaerolineales bacterium]|nr:glycoside hydrolase family 13 protein [Anaerolineales bacterium]